MPAHVAIIMDGNGRWAQSRGLPRTTGHRAGVEALRPVVKACVDHGVKYLTVFAFSTENWKRPKPEVEALMGLLVEYFDKEIETFRREGIRIRIIGRRDNLSRTVLEVIERTEERTAACRRLVLTVAFNYGARAEIADAARSIARLARDGALDPETVDEQYFASHLYTGDMPDPDLVIRPSGEMRVSNFLLWQCAYAEFWFTPTYWPDFTAEHINRAIADYRSRARRYGGLPAPSRG
ncbi:MAG: isoprenyl transferase [Ignavibacteriales bacterium]